LQNDTFARFAKAYFSTELDPSILENGGSIFQNGAIVNDPIAIRQAGMSRNFSP